MKYQNILKAAVTASAAMVLGSSALADTVKAELLQDIRLETQKCAVPLVQVPGTPSANQAPTIAGYKSMCSTLKVITPGTAQIFIDGEWYLAKIAESKESDGGDLDDLFIFNSKGALVAKRINVPAYDNVIVAMGGPK
jgi:hypothetical protein